MNAVEATNQFLVPFEAIDLAQLAQVDFEGRIDTKFIFQADKLEAFLTAIQPHSVLLEVNGERFFNYRNIYFDTSDFSLFALHRAGRKTRLKLRARAYHQNGPFVFEIKRKTNKGLTRKERLSLTSLDQAVSPLTNEFLQDRLGYGFEILTRHIPVNYSRMTFANKALTEKFTLDIHLHTVSNSQILIFQNLAIAELKQERFSNNSIFMYHLRRLGIQQHAFSKYCAAVMLLNQDIKKNRFLPIIRKLNKIANGTHY